MNPVVDARPQQAIRTIFIADDDSDDIGFFTEAIKQIDPTIKVETLNNGEALLNLLSSYMPDIVFLDLDMPLKNGLQCLKEIRDNIKTLNLPVVVYSSTNRPANISTAYEMGAHLVFVKPSVYSELVRSIETILKFDWADPNQIKTKYYLDGRCSAFEITS